MKPVIAGFHDECSRPSCRLPMLGMLAQVCFDTPSYSLAGQCAWPLQKKTALKCDASVELAIQAHTELHAQVCSCMSHT